MAELIQALNNELRRMEEEIRRANDPGVHGVLDLKGRRLINVAKSHASRDVPNRSELQDLALFENESGQHVAHSTIVAPHGVRSKAQAREKDDLVPLGQLRKIVASAAGGNAVLTANIDQTVEGYKTFQGLATPRHPVSVFTGANHNVSVASGGPSGLFIYLGGPSAAFSITGIRRSLTSPGGNPGQLVILYNSTAFSMTIAHENSGSAAENRFKLSNASNVVVGRDGSLLLLYSDIAARWISVARV